MPRGVLDFGCPGTPTADGIAFGGRYLNCRSREAVSGRRCVDAAAIRGSPRQGFAGRIGMLAASPVCGGDRLLESVRLEVDAIALRSLSCFLEDKLVEHGTARNLAL